MKKLTKNTIEKAGNSDEILGLSLISASIVEVISLIEKRLENQQKTFITTPNPEFLVFAQENPWFRTILKQADLAIPDGVALLWAREVLKGNNLPARLIIGFNTGLKVVFQGWGSKRVTGTDLTEKLCQLAAKNSYSVYFLGGQGQTASLALKNIQAKYNSLKGWADTGPNIKLKNGNWELGLKEADKAVTEINQKQPDLLFVAFGMGKQEKFIYDNWDQLKVKLAIGVGGSFDYHSGQIQRAPEKIRNAGFEWLYRLLKEPWRFKRQLRLLKFIWLILTDKN